MKLTSACALAFFATAAVADPAPCDLLKEGDVRKALGGEWKNMDFLSKAEVCAYQSGPTRFVTLLVSQDPLGAAALLEVRRKMAGDKAKPAAGPGAGAFRFSNAMANAIVFGKGEIVAQIDASPDATKDPGVLDRLAKAAYDRMP